MSAPFASPMRTSCSAERDTKSIRCDLRSYSEAPGRTSCAMITRGPYDKRGGARPSVAVGGVRTVAHGFEPWEIRRALRCEPALSGRKKAFFRPLKRAQKIRAIG